MHQNGRTDRIADIQHLVKAVDQQHTIARGIKFVVDLLDVRAVCRNDFFDLDLVVDIGVSGKEDDKQQYNDQQKIAACSANACLEEYVLVFSAVAGKDLGLGGGHAGGHFNAKCFA